MDGIKPDCSACKIPDISGADNNLALKLHHLCASGFARDNGGLPMVLGLLGIRLTPDKGNTLLERLIAIHEEVESYGREQGKDNPGC